LQPIEERIICGLFQGLVNTCRGSRSLSDDQPLQWKLFLEQQAKEHKDHVEVSRISQTGNAAVDKLYFDYTFKVKSGATLSSRCGFWMMERKPTSRCRA